MPTCKKCTHNFPWRAWINGKKVNLRNRKYCFDCSPFGSHNTKQIHLPNHERIVVSKKCVTCGHDIDVKWRRGNYCDNCLQKARTARVRDRVHGIVGEVCWICGYGKGIIGRKILDFHHVYPEKKAFNLSVRNMCNLNWARVYGEIKKCVLVCCRCHREIEYGLIDNLTVVKLHNDFWIERASNSAVEYGTDNAGVGSSILSSPTT